MSCQTSIFLQDPSGQTWAVQVLDSGVLQQVQQAGIAATPTLTDLVLGATSWVIGITTGGMLTTIPTTFNPSYEKRIPLRAPSGGQWFLTVTSGGILQQIGGNPTAVGPVVGQLFPPDDAYQKAKQPGGIGTPVTDPLSYAPGPYPNLNVSTPVGMAALGLWASPCGHWFNNLMVQSCSLGCGPSAIICCPICGYVIQIITPYSLIHTDSYAYLFA